jgi:hypothetical protein
MTLETRVKRLEEQAGTRRAGLELHIHDGAACAKCAEIEALHPAARQAVRVHAVRFVEAVRPPRS